ncbi:cardiolipin synthase ClsB [Rhodoferax sp.]|uniref:cardiolipin synthase ClsB n=1 Tax=Rhodoferax sp. TaxID=50421 RepID=UPI00263452B2|nr:cardiolipin synthase ClsB [Rhodoferax sp.]MDD2924243.1 cardiolipin synthase ClsB [Rhodoferax sp.]
MSDYLTGHRVQLLQGASEFFEALIQEMDAALHEVRLETYIFNVQGSGEQVAQALMRAAGRGVAVFLATDGVGTPRLPEPWPQQLAAAGVQWLVYSPLGRLGLLVPSRWRRLHRKLCVVDGHVAFCGGINVLDDWWDPHHGALDGPRFDFAVRVTGPLVQAAHTAMAQFWWRLRAVRSAQQVDWTGAWEALQQAVREKRQADHVEERHGGARAELVLRDNVRYRTRIERAYRQALGEARHSIILAHAYFLPSRKIRKSLIHAAQRGVRVRLLLQGRYEYFMQYHAAHALYDSLLAAGVEIYEYQSSFLHAKVAVVDDHWATVGSSNIDPLSLLLAREANVVVSDQKFAKDLRLQLEQAMAKHALRLDLQRHVRRPVGQKLRDHAALLLMRTLLFIYGKRY